MKNISIKIILLSVVIFILATACKKVFVDLGEYSATGVAHNGDEGSFTDTRDNQTYNTVYIGSQWWLAENMNYKTPNSSWYENSSNNGSMYGRLYTWDAAQIACPSGWHLPSDDEWKDLESQLGMSVYEVDNEGNRGSSVASKLKAQSKWGIQEVSNSSGFTALPGGFMMPNTHFALLESDGFWWTSSKSQEEGRSWRRSLYDQGDYVNRETSITANRYSVRCVKDTEGSVLSNFSADTTSGEMPLVVKFTDLSENGPISWHWDFGDSITSSLQNPTHTYTMPGEYSVILSVENNTSSDSEYKNAFISVQGDISPPVADFMATPVSGESPLLVTFTDKSERADEWLWDFGDGETSNEKNPVHTYTSSGEYDVELTVYNEYGNDTKFVYRYIEVNTTPVAEFYAEPTEGYAPLTVQFYDQSVNATSWYWSFGDGETSTEANPVHTYNSPSSYTVILNIINDQSVSSVVKYDYITVQENGGGLNTFTDSRDGYTYNIVEIGSQTWFAENLRYAVENSCIYDNNSAIGEIYGRLYTWDAALTACPVGWHLPSDDEWFVLTDHLFFNVGGKLKESGTLHWESPNTGADNSSGFTALPGGGNFMNGNGFDQIGLYGYWWTSQEEPNNKAWFHTLSNVSNVVGHTYLDKSNSLSVRCLKD